MLRRAATRPCVSRHGTLAAGPRIHGIPLVELLGGTSLIPLTRNTWSRASLAYEPTTEREYAVDKGRIWERRGVDLARVEGAATQLGPAGGDITNSPVIGGNSVLEDLGNNEYRAYLPNMSSTFFYFYVGAAISGDHTLCFEWRKTPGSSETGTLTIQGQSTLNQGPVYLSGGSPPDDWTRLCLTKTEPGTSIRLAFGDVGGVDFQIRYAQFEENSYPTTWIPKPGTARAADRASLSKGPSSAGALVFAFKRPYDHVTGEQFRIFETTLGSGDLLLDVTAAGLLDFYREGVQLYVEPGKTAFTDWRTAVVSWNGAAIDFDIDGVNVYSATPGAVDYTTIDVFNNASLGKALAGFGAAYQLGFDVDAATRSAISADLLARLS